MSAKKIYFSSSFRDLGLYRAKASEVLRYLADFFLLVRPVEEMLPGSSQPPLIDCLEYVQQCDIYVLIIGKIYGAIPGSQEKSFTQFEYEKARNSGKIILPFIADNNAPDLMEEIEHKNLFDEFKGEVMQNYVTYIRPFSNPDGLGWQLSVALTRYAVNKGNANTSDESSGKDDSAV